MMMSKKPKVIFIMGATGTGKSKLSVDIATRFPAEIINSDKIQCYKGLDIVTNKLHESERGGIPHHLLGFISNPDAEFTAEDFCCHANKSISIITGRGRTPIVVGGSISYLEALVDTDFRAKYSLCFIWLDVELLVLFDYVNERVDQMVEAGLVEEIREYFEPGLDYSRGIRRAIGVPEMDKYFLSEMQQLKDGNNLDKEVFLRPAIQETKLNTQMLVLRQVEKIRRLRDELGWELHRIDPTTVFKRRRAAEDKAAAWNEVVLTPCLKIVGEFLEEDQVLSGGDHEEENKINVELNVKADQFRSTSPIFAL